MGAAEAESTSLPSAQEATRVVQEVLARGHYHLEPQTRLMVDFSWLLDWLGVLFRPIAAVASRLPFPVTLCLVVLLGLGLAALAVAAGLALTRTRQRQAEQSANPIDDSDPVVLEQNALRLAAAGNYVDASRKLFHAALALIERKRGGRLRLSLTNSEYLATFRTRGVIDNLTVFVRLINEKWYRDMRFEEGDFVLCRRAYDRLRSHLEQQPG